MSAGCAATGLFATTIRAEASSPRLPQWRSARLARGLDAIRLYPTSRAEIARLVRASRPTASLTDDLAEGRRAVVLPLILAETIGILTLPSGVPGAPRGSMEIAVTPRGSLIRDQVSPAGETGANDGCGKMFPAISPLVNVAVFARPATATERDDDATRRTEDQTLGPVSGPGGRPDCITRMVMHRASPPSVCGRAPGCPWGKDSTGERCRPLPLVVRCSTYTTCRPECMHSTHDYACVLSLFRFAVLHDRQSVCTSEASPLWMWSSTRSSIAPHLAHLRPRRAVRVARHSRP